MEYIYTTPSLSRDLCDTIISRYEEENELKYHGVTYKGLDKNVKDTTDMVIPMTEVWNDLNEVLSNELEKHLKVYINTLNDKPNFKEENNYASSYKHLEGRLFLNSNFMIQKYEKQKGKYVYHDDGSIEKDRYRVITYLWYLNDVEEGGETDFFGGTFNIKPEAGKLLFFPSFWSFPHRGNRPRSSDKYIITGWLYKETISREMHIPNISLPNMRTLKYEPDTNRENDFVEQSECNITEPMKEKKLIFDYFYKPHKTLFLDYKYNTFKQMTLFLFSEYVCIWMIEQLKEECIDIIDLNKVSKLIHFLMSSFEIIMSYIKTTYQINPMFHIKEWFAIKHPTQPYLFDEKEYDLCVQIDLSSGRAYFGKNFLTIEKSQYSLVYFIDFAFEYFNHRNEKKTLTLKEIATPFYEEI